ncbi:MAG: thioredoxin family protein [Verrucomicrobiota bacterium]
MKFYKTLFLTLLATITISASAQEKAELTFHDDFAKASQDAEATSRPIILIFSASWCPPCQTMKKEVYPSEEVSPFWDKFVWAYIDADDPKQRDLMTEHGVQGIPHISYLDAKSNIIGKTVGALSKTDFAEALETLIERTTAIKNASTSP